MFLCSRLESVCLTSHHQSFFFVDCTRDERYIYPKEETLPPTRRRSVDEEEETTPHVVRVFARPILWWRVLAADRDSAAPGKLFYTRER